MFKITRIEIGMLAALLILGALFFLPVYPASALYRDVADKNPRIFDLSWLPPDHILDENKLYLRTQVARPCTFLVTWVSSDTWNAQAIEDFRQAHPELEAYWPNQGERDGGVTWLAVEK